MNNFNSVCKSGNIMVEQQDNSPDTTPSGECCECGCNYGEHKCCWCLEPIEADVCEKYEGACKGCREWLDENA